VNIEQCATACPNRIILTTDCEVTQGEAAKTGCLSL